MKRLTATLALTAFALGAAEIKPPEIKALTGEPNTTSRTVSYHDTDIVPIDTEVRYTTLIQLPREESILEVTCGDKDFWPVNWNANLAYVKPAKQGSKTNMNLITASGNVYSFLLTEITGNPAMHADLKVFVTPSDPGALAAMNDKPRFISADAVEPYRKAAELARQQMLDQSAALRKEIDGEKTELQAALPATIHHDYRWLTPAKNPFHVTAIYHDDKMTYIEATPQEAPAIYETKDGKPSLIQFELKDGRYIIPKILDDGYMRVGKGQLTFHRDNN